MKKRFVVLFVLIILLCNFSSALTQPAPADIEKPPGETPELDQTQKTLVQLNKDLSNTGIKDVSVPEGTPVSTSGDTTFLGEATLTINNNQAQGTNLQIKKTPEGPLISGNLVIRKLEGTFSTEGATEIKVNKNGDTEVKHATAIQIEQKSSRTIAINAHDVKDNDQTTTIRSADIVKHETLEKGYQLENAFNIHIDKTTNTITAKKADVTTKDNTINIQGGEDIIMTPQQFNLRSANFVQVPNSISSYVQDYKYNIPTRDIQFKKVSNIVINTKNGLTNINNVRGQIQLHDSVIKLANIQSLINNNTIRLPTPLTYAPVLTTTLDKGDWLSYIIL